MLSVTGNKDLENISERLNNNEISAQDALTILNNGIKRKFEKKEEPQYNDAEQKYANYSLETLGIGPLNKYAAANYNQYLYDRDDLVKEIDEREKNINEAISEEKFIKDLIKENKSYPNARKIPNTLLKSEVIPLNERRAVYRDSKDHTPVENTSGSIITFFGGNNDTFLPYNENDKYPTHDGYFNANIGFVGLNDKDSLKISNNIKDFETGNWRIRKIPYHDVIDFNEENGYPKIGTYDPQNPSNDVPLIKATRDGKEYNAYLPILTKKSISNFGGAHGGQVIMQFGDKTYYVSGSIDKIHKTFNKMKKHYGADNGRIYLLDNGTFNYGLKPTGNRIDSNTHKAYSLLNSYGGDAVFLYNK